MGLHITGRNITVTPAIRAYIEKKIQKLERFSHRITSVHAILQIQRFNQMVEIQVLGKNLDIIVKESSKDMYSSFDLALDRIVIAVERREEKKKGQSKRVSRKAREKIKQSASEQLKQAYDAFPKVVRANPEQYQPMTVQQAAITLGGRKKSSFLVFENSDTKQINVVHKRKDGTLEWVEPS